MAACWASPVWTPAASAAVGGPRRLRVPGARRPRVAAAVGGARGGEGEGALGAGGQGLQARESPRFSGRKAIKRSLKGL